MNTKNFQAFYLWYLSFHQSCGLALSRRDKCGMSSQTWYNHFVPLWEPMKLWNGHNGSAYTGSYQQPTMISCQSGTFWHGIKPPILTLVHVIISWPDHDTFGFNIKGIMKLAGIILYFVGSYWSSKLRFIKRKLGIFFERISLNKQNGSPVPLHGIIHVV